VVETLGVIFTSIASIAGSCALILKYKSQKDKDLENLKYKHQEALNSKFEIQFKSIARDIESSQKIIKDSQGQITNVSLEFKATKSSMDKVLEWATKYLKKENEVIIKLKKDTESVKDTLDYATLTFSAFTGAPYNVTATTTAPTLSGNNTENYYRYRRKGRFIHVWAKFQGAAAGVVGSGDYIWPMLPNITIDTAIHPLVTTATAVQSINSQVTSNFTDLHPAIGGRVFMSGNQYAVNMWAPYTSSTYRIFGTQTNTDGLYPVGSSFGTAAGTTATYHFQFEAAVSGWKA